MTRQFVILCSAQRLPYQDIDDKLAFGLNVPAAIGLTPGEGSVTPQEAIALRPCGFGHGSRTCALLITRREQAHLMLRWYRCRATHLFLMLTFLHWSMS